MQLNKRTLALIAMAVFVIAQASAAYRLVLQSGHEDLPVAVEWHADSRTVVSVGNDGRLIVTRPRDNRVLHRFRVSSDTVQNLSVNPAGDRAAIVLRGDDGYSVAVWDWGDEELVYEYALESEPLFLKWSARGRYLVIGNLGDPSVIVLEGRTGRRLSYLQRLPSLYNDGYIGSTETILMTYSSSGSIRYWDIRSSALKLSAETISNLTSVTVLQTGSKTTMFGYRNNTLYLVNRQTGAVLDQKDVPGLVDVSIDGTTGHLDALSTTVAGSVLRRYDASGERIIPRGNGSSALETEASPIPLDPTMKPVKVLRRSGTTFLMSETGTLFSGDDAGFSPVIDDRIRRIDSIAFDGDSIYLSHGPSVQRFTSSFFGGDSDGQLDRLEGMTREERTLSSRAGDTGLTALGDGRLVLWDNGGAPSSNGYRIFRFEQDGEEFHPIAGILQKMAAIDGERLLSVDRNGSISIIHAKDGTASGFYSGLGILDAAYSAGEDFVLAGRSSAGRAGTPVEQIDMRTGESVPVSDRRFMVYSVESGPEGLYTIGVDRTDASRPKTILVRHELNRPERTRIVHQTAGEDLDAFVLPHPEGDGVFTNLGGTIQGIDGNRKTRFDWDDPVTSLGYRGKVLYGIDDDGALVLWNASSGRAMLRVYFFDDGGWIALPPGSDRIWATPGAIENVVLYRDGRPVDPRRVSYSSVGTEPSAM